MKEIVCKIDDKFNACIEVKGNYIDVIVMTACILKDVSCLLKMPVDSLVELCNANMDNIVGAEKQEKNKPKSDAGIDIFLEDLQKLLNDIDGKDEHK